MKFRPLISSFLLFSIYSTIFCQNAERYTASLVAEWGNNDTACVETFTIVDNHLMGSAVHLYPEPHMRRFSFWYNEDGSMRSFDIQFFDLTNTSVPLESKSGFLPYRILMNASNEIVDFRVVDKNGEKQYVHLSPRIDFNGDWIPILGQWEWLSGRICHNQLDQGLKFLNYSVGIYEMELRKEGEDEVIFESGISAPISFFLGNDRIKEIDAMGSPWNYKVKQSERILSIEEYSKRFSTKPVIGDPSPRGEFSGSINGCEIKGSYGRPYKRGRKIFGNVVPYDVVWRTGSASATTISFDKDLDFNGVVIPKGTYNIFTIPNKEKWSLIFNTEENAWGSAYRSAYDFAQINMKAKVLDEVVDQFTIRIKEEGGKGILQLKWDMTMAQVTFNVKK